MSQKLVPYERYKDSGVEWLGKIPDHWESISIKWLSPVWRGASPRPIEDPKYFSETGEYSWVRISDVTASNGYLTESSELLSDLGASLSVKLEVGQLFISIAGSVGKPCITKIKACIHDGFVYFPELRIDPVWLFKVFEAGECYGGLGKMGTQLNLNTDTIGSIRIALPPENEIRALLAYLDKQTSRIDVLVKEQEELILLLKEKRQALISHAVTKGLDPNATMKPSGVEWIGDIPESWESYPLKREISFLTSGARGWAENYSDDGALFIRIGNLTRDRLELDLSDIQRVRVPDGQESDRTRVQSGDILFSITAYLGSVAVVPSGLEDSYVSQHVALARLRKDSNVASEWVGSLVLSSIGKAYLGSQGYGGTKVQLSLDDVLNFLLVVPPPSEQTSILEHIRQESDRFGALILEAESTITLMQEHRSALISAVVTGKVRVPA